MKQFAFKLPLRSRHFLKILTFLHSLETYCRYILNFPEVEDESDVCKGVLKFSLSVIIIFVDLLDIM